MPTESGAFRHMAQSAHVPLSLWFPRTVPNWFLSQWEGSASICHPLPLSLPLSRLFLPLRPALPMASHCSWSCCLHQPQASVLIKKKMSWTFRGLCSRVFYTPLSSLNIKELNHARLCRLAIVFKPVIFLLKRISAWSLFCFLRVLC